MNIYKNKLLFILIIFCIFNIRSFVLCKNELGKINLNFNFSVGTSIPAFSQGFLSEYNSTIGGKKEDFNNYSSFAASLSAQWIEFLRFSLQVSANRFILQDRFSKETYPTSGTWRNFSEDMSVSDVPILLFVDWVHFYNKYKVYVGGALGGSFSMMKWSEIVDSPLNDDIRVGGTIINKNSLFFAIGLHSGISLDFDKESVPPFVKGLFFETNILFVDRYFDVFEKLRNQILPVANELNGNKFMLPITIGFQLGVMLNLESKQINRVFGN
jgi:hypothetical protein